MRVSRARVGSLRVGAGLPEDRERWIRPFGTARSEEPKPSGPTGAGNATPCKARNPRRSFGRSRPRPQDRGPSPRPTSAPRGPLARGPRAPRSPIAPSLPEPLEPSLTRRTSSPSRGQYLTPGWAPQRAAGTPRGGAGSRTGAPDKYYRGPRQAFPRRRGRKRPAIRANKPKPAPARPCENVPGRPTSPTGVPDKPHRGARQMLPGSPTNTTGVPDKRHRGARQMLPGSPTSRRRKNCCKWGHFASALGRPLFLFLLWCYVV
jgi:hypothetical protein